MIRSYPPRPCRAPRWPPRAGSRPTSSSREAMRASSRASVAGAPGRRAARWPSFAAICLRPSARMTAVSLQDLYGNAVSSTSRAAVDAYDRGVRGLLGFSADVIDSFRAAVAADPDFVLARAALATALFLAEKMAEAKAEMQQAAAAAPALPPRERRHAETAALWVPGRSPQAPPLTPPRLA